MMRKPAEPAKQPRFPSQKRRCKYCHVMFDTPPTYNGQHQDFCIPAHRKAFHKEGRKPIAAILKRQEKHMRQIAREEAATIVNAALARFGQIATPTGPYPILPLSGQQQIPSLSPTEPESTDDVISAIRTKGPGKMGREMAQRLVDSFSPSR